MFFRANGTSTDTQMQLVPSRTGRLVDRRCTALPVEIIKTVVPTRRATHSTPNPIHSSSPRSLAQSKTRTHSQSQENSALRFSMLRGMRERLRLRRSRRPELNGATNDVAQTSSTPPAGSPLSSRAMDRAALRSEKSDTTEVTEAGQSSNIVTAPDDSAETVTHTASASAATSDHHQQEDGLRQPRVFRNRSLEYGQKRDRQFLGIFAGRGLRTFHRPRSSPDNGQSQRDRPLEDTEPSAPAHPEDATRPRNDDSFSSLPSTHASRDPFLNDDVPIEVSRIDALEDRPRANGSCDIVDDSLGRPTNGKSTITTTTAMGIGAGKGETHGRSPPASLCSSATSRKRSSLWKRKYDPDAEFQSRHERDILKAVALSESSVKERSVRAAQQLAAIVDAQLTEISDVLTDVDKRVESARFVADNLPFVGDPKFEPYLHSRDAVDERESSVTKGDTERLFLDLMWTERVWDVEALTVEKRFDDAVASIEKLRKDGIAKAGSSRTFAKFQSLILQLVSEMTACCSQGGGETAAIFAPLLGRLGMADHARQVVLDSAEAELLAELRYITSNSQDLTPRTINVILDKTLSVFKLTHSVYTKISSKESTSASCFVAWVVEQSDKVYREFISPVLERMKKADPVTILAAIEAARRRRVHRRSATEKDEDKSADVLLETRLTTHVRHDLEGPIRDAERQLMERARMYASATPRNWREGPYQSGKAVCDELNVLSVGLEGALMNLGPEADVLIGNLLVRSALVYCTTLLEMGSKAVGDRDIDEDDGNGIGGNGSLALEEVEQGVFATFTIVGRTLMQLHEKYGHIPMLERVASVLMSPSLGEVRILQAEVFARRVKTSIKPHHNRAMKMRRSGNFGRVV